MPLLEIAISGQSDQARNNRIADQLTQLTEHHLGKDPALTAITINRLSETDWFISGRPLGANTDASFSLRITVTQGTNTKSQMQDYIEAVFSVMTEQIANLRAESYIIIQEVPAAAWGYAGITQEHRFIAAQKLKT